MKFVKRYKWFLLVIAVLAVGGFFWWRSRAAAKTVVKTTTVSQKDLQKVLSVSGHVDAHERAVMYFLGGGKLTYLGAHEGDTVKKGQTIAMIDPRIAQKTLEKTLSTYDTQRSTFDGNTDNRVDRTLPKAEQRVAAQDQFALNRSVFDVQLQSLAVENTRLSSPFAGILVQSPAIAVGGVLAPTDNFDIINPASLYFHIEVDEVDMDSLTVGQQVEVKLDARPDQVLHAQIQKIAYQSVETSTGTVFPVDLVFTDPVDINHQRVGMNGDANIILDTRKGVQSVPISAIISRDGKDYVKVKKGDAIVEQQVETGLETDNDVEIRSGLTLQDQVVLP